MKNESFCPLGLDRSISAVRVDLSMIELPCTMHSQYIVVIVAKIEAYPPGISKNYPTFIDDKREYIPKILEAFYEINRLKLT